MCVHAGAMLGLSFLPKVKWFLPVTPQNRGQFTEVFSREEGLLGLAKPTEPDVVLVARNQFIEDAMTTLAHEVFHLAQFGYAKNTGMPSDDHVELSADEFAAEAVATIDWNRHSDAALEWLVKLPAESPVSGDTGDDRQAHLKASLRRVGQQVKTYAERCVKTAQNPKASREDVEEAHRRVEEWAQRFDILARAAGVATVGDSPPTQKEHASSRGTGGVGLRSQRR
jgi:hypothetical protein